MTGRLDAAHLREVEERLRLVGDELALFLVYERPSQVESRPALARTYFAQRCVTETFLGQMIDAFRSIGAYVELFDGELPFLRALADGLLERTDRPIRVAYNGIGFGITDGGFEPGRMALVPSVADSYGVVCANSDAYTCAFALHRFHSFVVLRSLGVKAPPVWHYRRAEGWMGPRPPDGTKVIAKSTYEAWSVGVDDDSIFVVDETCERRAAVIAGRIGQPVTLQQFISGREVCLPVLAVPERIVTPPVEQVLSKAPGDPDAVMTIDDNLDQAGVSYVPFDGPVEVLAQMRDTSLAVFDIFQTRAVGRMDFRVDAEGEAWLTDAAITPGISTASSAFASIKQYGFEHPSFLRLIVAASLAARGLLPCG